MARCGGGNFGMCNSVERPMTCGDDDIAAFIFRIRIRTSIAAALAMRRMRRLTEFSRLL